MRACLLVTTEMSERVNMCVCVCVCVPGDVALKETRTVFFIQNLLFSYGLAPIPPFLNN